MTADDDIVVQCEAESLRLLQRNLTPQGILAATPGELAEARRYTRIFGRDAAICVLAMAGSGVDALEQGAVASLDALAQQQARNGQIPKYVDPLGADADFWYLGCIDATLWWLIAIAVLGWMHGRRLATVGAGLGMLAQGLGLLVLQLTFASSLARLV